MTGLTSITFRTLTADKIISLCRNAGVDGIEWGGDVHVPPAATDEKDAVLKSVAQAQSVAKKTTEAGLRIFSYGSYYKLAANRTIPFDRIWANTLAVAEALHAPIIRVWAGEYGSKDAPPNYKARLVDELKKISQMAAEKNISIGLEYHRKTLTDTKESCLELLQTVNMPNVYTYWQPNPDITMNEQLAEIALLRDYICIVHCFNWTPGNIRHPMHPAKNVWKQYWMQLSKPDCPLLTEFVRNDEPRQFIADAQILKEITY